MPKYETLGVDLPRRVQTYDAKQIDVAFYEHNPWLVHNQLQKILVNRKKIGHNTVELELIYGTKYLFWLIIFFYNYLAFLNKLFGMIDSRTGWMVEQEMQLPKAPSKKKAPKF